MSYLCIIKYIYIHTILYKNFYIYLNKNNKNTDIQYNILNIQYFTKLLKVFHNFIHSYTKTKFVFFLELNLKYQIHSENTSYPQFNLTTYLVRFKS